MLFDGEEREKQGQMDAGVADKIKERFGTDALRRGSGLRGKSPKKLSVDSESREELAAFWSQPAGSNVPKRPERPSAVPISTAQKLYLIHSLSQPERYLQRYLRTQKTTTAPSGGRFISRLLSITSIQSGRLDLNQRPLGPEPSA